MDKYNSLEEFRKNYHFRYIDVGARWGEKTDLLTLFPNSKWIGFEPDPNEFSVINSKKKPWQECFPFALSDKSGSQNLYITKSPDWSSLYEPDPQVFNQFKGLKDFYHVTHYNQVPLRSLDELAVSHQDLLRNIDYLKLDVQGAEVDVLRGATIALSSSLVGVEVEVEFIPLYKRQPLFNQVHEIMMDNGFLLFDITRNKCTRFGFEIDMETRGQVVWSDALYLKDFSILETRNCVDKILVLLLIAMKFGFPDYSMSIAKSAYARGIISDHILLEVSNAINEFRVRQRQRTRIIDTIANLPYGKKFLRYLRKVIDDNYDRVVSLSHPEYYFRRD